MSKKTPAPKGSNRDQSLKKLIEDLRRIDPQAGNAAPADVEILPMMLDEVERGVDLSARYPSFYRKLLGDAQLRGLFLDALEALEQSRAASVARTAWGKPGLGFLAESSPHSIGGQSGSPAWQARLRRSSAQLQQAFFPRPLAYRVEPHLFDASPLVLVRETLEVGRWSCEISLVGRPVPSNDQVYSLTLTAAVNEPGGAALFPARVILVWGAYQASVLMRAEGRVELPDIALVDILDGRRRKVRAGLDLSLEPG